MQFFDQFYFNKLGGFGNYEEGDFSLMEGLEEPVTPPPPLAVRVTTSCWTREFVDLSSKSFASLSRKLKLQKRHERRNAVDMCSNSLNLKQKTHFWLSSDCNELEAMCDRFFSSDVVIHFNSLPIHVKIHTISQADQLMNVMPTYCLRKNYINFPVENLVDASVDVRLACLHSLSDRLDQYIKPTWLTSASRRKLIARFVEHALWNFLIISNDEDVATLACNLIGKVTMTPNLLSEEHVMKVFKHLLALDSCNASSPSPTAVEVFHQYLQSLANGDRRQKALATAVTKKIFLDISYSDRPFTVVDEAGAIDVGQISDHCDVDYLVSLCRFLSKLENEDHAKKVTASLLPLGKALQSWNSYITILLQFSPGKLCQQEISTPVLLQLMITVVSMIYKENKVSYNFDTFQLQSAMDVLSVWLPSLIRHFMATGTSLPNIPLLLKIIPFFYVKFDLVDFDVLDNLLMSLHEVAHADVLPGVIESIAETFNFLKAHLSTWKSHCLSTFNHMMECYQINLNCLTVQLPSKSKPSVTITDTASVVALGFRMVSVVGKLLVFAEKADLTESFVFEKSCLAMLEAASHYSELLEITVEPAVNFVKLSLVWLSRRLVKLLGNDAVDTEALDATEIRFSSLLSALVKHLTTIIPLTKDIRPRLYQAMTAHLKSLQINYPSFFSQK